MTGILLEPYSVVPGVECVVFALIGEWRLSEPKARTETLGEAEAQFQVCVTYTILVFEINL